MVMFCILYFVNVLERLYKVDISFLVWVLVLDVKFQLYYVIKQQIKVEVGVIVIVQVYKKVIFMWYVKWIFVMFIVKYILD